MIGFSVGIGAVLLAVRTGAVVVVLAVALVAIVAILAYGRRRH
jgi:hypothetical protein